MYIFLSHDVDWPLSGPGKEHILARRYRFSEEVIRKVESMNCNPYHGIRLVADIEETLGVRSTFFFRPYYDDSSSVDAYSDEMKVLSAEGFEVGAHLNEATSLSSILKQKETIERALGSKVVGSRVHYLRILQKDFNLLQKAGFLYDSSMVFSKNGFDERNTGYLKEDELIIIPITYMDAYLFSYAKLSEETVVDYVYSTLSKARESGVKLATILWHDNAILMQGGRAYGALLRRLLSLNDAHFIRGIDAYDLVTKGRDI